jgi:hypothetical protein
MTSFDSKTPKNFSTTSGHQVLLSDGSYFDSIGGSHTEWADVGTGFKMRLQDALAAFQVLHGNFINQVVGIGSKVHTVVQAALTESSAWIVGYIQFIDEYYRELAKEKNGPSKAWHFTTRLAKHILDKVGTPRHGVQEAFQVGKSSLWLILKSHVVIMTAYKRLDFENHPTTATELVKFLAINTSFEAIEKVPMKARWHTWNSTWWSSKSSFLRQPTRQLHLPLTKQTNARSRETVFPSEC